MPSQRPEYSPNVFGASENTPPTHTLHMHNEQAYLTPEAEPTYPRKIFFSCLQPAASGGQTPLVLNREFHAALGEIRRRLRTTLLAGLRVHANGRAIQVI